MPLSALNLVPQQWLLKWSCFLPYAFVTDIQQVSPSEVYLGNGRWPPVQILIVVSDNWLSKSIYQKKEERKQTERDRERDQPLFFFLPRYSFFTFLSSYYSEKSMLYVRLI